MRLELLDQPIPKTAVTQRTQSGVKLDYLEGWYVIDRLNQVFGTLGWSVEVVCTERVQLEQKPKANGNGDNWYVGYLAHVRIKCGHDTQAVKEDYGFGQGIDNDLGKAHESAVKEAVTDALKRCAKDLGMSMGLALYDKTKANVSAEPAKPDPPAVAAARHLKAVCNLAPENARLLWNEIRKANGNDDAQSLADVLALDEGSALACLKAISEAA